MEKLKKIKKSSISKAEYELIQKLNENYMSIFDVSNAQKLLECKRTKAYQLIHSLKQKKIISHIKGGRHALALLSMKPDVFSIASSIVWPSYISFWTALSYYKFTEQLPATIFVATTKARAQISLRESRIKFVKLSKTRFFGYRKIDGTVFADREKAIIDSILLPRYAGGIPEVFKCLRNAWGEIDQDTLVDYAVRMKNRSLLKRLGYMIELAKLSMGGELMHILRADLGRGYSKLDAQGEKKGKLNKRWGLIINRSAYAD